MAFDNFSKPNVPGIGGGHHHQDIVATYPKEVESFKFPRYQPIRDFLNDAHPMIGVDNLIADVEMADHKARPTAPVVVASVQTLARSSRRERWPRDYFGLVVVDEAHHALAVARLT